MQHEAKAHIAVQKWIDDGGLKKIGVCTARGIRAVHQRFCEQLPEDLLWVEDPATKVRHRVIPGELRTQDVQVGRLVPVSPGAIPRFLQRFEQVLSGLGKTDSVLSVAAAHHRLLWIHPYLDGNGRVARLLSHAMLLGTLQIGTSQGSYSALGRRSDPAGHPAR